MEIEKRIRRPCAATQCSKCANSFLEEISFVLLIYFILFRLIKTILNVFVKRTEMSGTAH